VFGLKLEGKNVQLIFPLFNGYIFNYPLLFWNPEINVIYDDLGLIIYEPGEEGNLRKFIPL